MSRLALAALLIFALAGQAAAQAANQVTAPDIQFQTRTLANGLKVITSVDRTTPNVTVQVWYGVGAKNDPQGRSGFAHLFEHMMFKATDQMPPEYMDRLTEDAGGMNNAFTQDDTTAFYEVIPAADLQRLIWAETERMSALVVDKANFRFRAPGGGGGAGVSGCWPPLRPPVLLSAPGRHLRSPPLPSLADRLDRGSGRGQPGRRADASTPPTTAPTTRPWWWWATSTRPGSTPGWTSISGRCRTRRSQFCRLPPSSRPAPGRGS